MRDNRSIEERLLEEGMDYQKIPVPGEMKARLEEGIARARAEKADAEKKAAAGKKTGADKRKTARFRIAWAAAAAALILVILPNTGAGIAHAMGSLPVVGKLFQAVTFRDYQYESGRFDADVEVPRILVEDGEQEGLNPAGQDAEKGEDPVKEKTPDRKDGTVPGRLQDTVEQINFDIEKVTDQLIEEFKEAADLGESYGSLEIHHETVTDNERYFTLKLSIYQGAGSGFESYKFYTIDKKTGERLQLGDLFREDSDHKEILSENIRTQMRAKMAEDEYNQYWVDYEEVPALNWEGLREDQNFYFDDAGDLVISFDEYEVAPGYMGAQEFTVKKEVFEGLLKG